MGTERAKKRAEGLRPFATQPISRRHGITPFRAAMPLPEGQVSTPARAARVDKTRWTGVYERLETVETAPVPAPPRRRRK